MIICRLILTLVFPTALAFWILLGYGPSFAENPQVIFGAAAVVGKLGVENFNPLLLALIHGFVGEPTIGKPSENHRKMVVFHGI